VVLLRNSSEQPVFIGSAVLGSEWFVSGKATDYSANLRKDNAQTGNNCPVFYKTERHAKNSESPPCFSHPL
jgi:hypothetical protein